MIRLKLLTVSVISAALISLSSMVLYVGPGAASAVVAASVAASSAAASSSSAQNLPCAALSSAEVIYMHRVNYYTVGNAWYMDAKVYVFLGEQGMSLKEYINKRFPDAKNVCIVPNPRDANFAIYFTR